MFHKDELCMNYFILACAIVISSGLAFWLYKDTDLIRIIELTRESGKLLLYEQYEDELKLRREAMAEIIDDEIDIICKKLDQNEYQVGEINYIFSRIVNSFFKRHKSYTTICEIDGILSGVAKEFYRRKAVPYEDEKIKENGDLP